MAQRSLMKKLLLIGALVAIPLALYAAVLSTTEVQALCRQYRTKIVKSGGVVYSCETLKPV